MAPGIRSNALTHERDRSPVAGISPPERSNFQEDKPEVDSSRKIIQELAVSPTWQFRIAVFFDLMMTAVIVFAAYGLSPIYSFSDPPARHASPQLLIPVFSLFFVVAALAAGLYEPKNYRNGVMLGLTTCIAVTATWCMVLLCVHFFTYQPVGRWIVGSTALGVVPVTMLSRRLLHRLTRRSVVRLILAGDESGARLLSRTAAETGIVELEIIPALSSGLRDASLKEPYSLGLTLASHRFDSIVVQDNCPPLLLDHVLACLQSGARVESLDSFFETTFEKVPIEVVSSAWAVNACVRATRPTSSVFKRGSDIVLAFTGLLCTLWFWPVIALLIRGTSTGPVFYLQDRVGLRGRIFRIIKFRTMCDNAETDTGVCWADKQDPRITAVGAVLRKLRIDELPQFINVLRGDMSVVGPRPERPEFVDRLEEKIPYYSLRHIVRPGITGWAQIRYPYGASMEDAVEKLRYDLYYVKHGTLLMDARILMRTIGAMFQGSR